MTFKPGCLKPVGSGRSKGQPRKSKLERACVKALIKAMTDNDAEMIAALTPLLASLKRAEEMSDDV